MRRMRFGMPTSVWQVRPPRIATERPIIRNDDWDDDLEEEFEPVRNDICKQIKFERGAGEVHFRGKSYTMCAAGVYTFAAFSSHIDPPGQRNRSINFFDEKGLKLSFKKSDYSRTKLYDWGGRKGLTLYITSTNKFEKDEKCIFIVETVLLPFLERSIHSFNYDKCNKDCLKDCPNKLISSEYNPEQKLSEDLFKIS